MYNIMNRDKVIGSFELFQGGYPMLVESRNTPKFISSNFVSWVRSRTGDEQGGRNLKSTIDIHKCLSLNDCLWVCGESCVASWADVNLFTNEFKPFNVNAVNRRITTPDLSTSGGLPKQWLRDDGIYLLKGCSSNISSGFGEAYSEVIASQVLGILGYSHVRYSLSLLNGNVASKCKLLNTEDISMVEATWLHTDDLTSFAVWCVSNGLISQLCEYITFDELCLNTDRHFGNIGILFDHSMNTVLSLAPIYDNGMSCLGGVSGECNISNYTDKAVSVRGISFENETDYVVSLCPEFQGGVHKLVSFKANREQLQDIDEKHLLSIEALIRDRALQMMSRNDKLL